MRSIPSYISLPSKEHILPIPPTTPIRPKQIYIHPPQSLSKVIPSFKARPAVLALIALTILSLFTVTHTLLSPSPPPPIKATNLRFSRLHATNSYKQDRRKQITLTAAEELAAIVQFISIHPSNALPLSVDPQKPVDPQLICGFDTRSEDAREEVNEMVSEVWVRNPIVLFTQSRIPLGKEVASLLASFETKPSPVIINIDERSDASVLSPIVTRLTASAKLPVLLIAGRPIQTSNIDALRQSNLKQLLKEAGAIIGGNKKKKHGKLAQD